MMQTVLFLAFQALATTEANAVTPIEKVVIMLRDLQGKCVSEGKEEATTYDKFACFCKSKTDEKATSIKEYETTVTTLSAELDGLQAFRTRLTAEIATCQANIVFYEEELANATAMRKNERIAYDKAFADMDEAVRAIESAIQTLKASKTGEDGSLQVGKVGGSALLKLKSTVNRAVDVADALGMDTVDSKATKVFLQGLQTPGNNVPRSDYDFHSDEIISTLEGLLSSFRREKTDLESEEVSAQASFDSAAQAKNDQISQEQSTMERKQMKLSDTTSEIASTNQVLTDSVATLNDDRVYLQDLTKQCEDKARVWNQRSSLRADELAAITQALSVIEGAVTHTASKTGQGARAAVVTNVLQTQAEDDEEVLDELTDVSFLQTQPDARVTKALSLLRTMSNKLHSATLSVLATKVQEDPFAKVKTLIQELIERLLQEASDEANQKGWCDTETQKATQDRDYRVRDLDELESTLMELYGRKGQLELLSEKLTDEIAQLKADLLNATQVRQEEKAENDETVKTSQDGADAVQQAMDILSHFYGEANQATVPAGNQTALLQQPSVDAPDAGFDDAYKGAQSASTGIIGMLEVIRGDFLRTLKSTLEDEETALRAFVDFERFNKASTAEKMAANSNTVSELKDVNTQIDEDVNDYKSKQQLLDGAVDALEKLHPVCQGSEEGMSYEDRKQRREDEIEALKSALCILDDGQGDYCGGQSFLQRKITKRA